MPDEPHIVGGPIPKSTYSRKYPDPMRAENPCALIDLPHPDRPVGSYARSACMNDMFEIAHESAYVKAALDIWRNGECTLEQALMMAIKALHRHCKGLENELIDKINKSTSFVRP